MVAVLLIEELCRLCDGSLAAMDACLSKVLEMGTAGGTGRGEMVLLQSQGSFFAYAPVLKALQKGKLPLARLLVYPGSGVLKKAFALSHLVRPSAITLPGMKAK